MKKLLTLLLISILLLASCDIFGPDAPKSKVYLISCGIGFEGTHNALGNPVRDSYAMVEQVAKVSEAAGYEYEIVWYTDALNYKGGKALDINRFTLTHFVNTTETGDTKQLFNNLLPLSAPITSDEFTVNFFDAVNEMFTTRPTDNDLVIFYFSGHGDNSLSLDNYGGPFLCYGEYKDTKHEEHSFLVAISYDKIFRELDMLKGRQFCIFDCCYSGASIENPGHFHNIYDHELGGTDRFEEDYSYSSGYTPNGKIEIISRSDKKAKFSLLSFMSSAFDNTFDKHKPGIPKRVVLNACNYGQLAMDSDIKKDPNIKMYGGMTYRILEHLGFDMKNMKSAYPNTSKKKTISGTDIYNAVYKNISRDLRETSTPNITRSSYDMLLWDFR